MIELDDLGKLRAATACSQVGGANPHEPTATSGAVKRRVSGAHERVRYVPDRAVNHAP